MQYLDKEMILNHIVALRIKASELIKFTGDEMMLRILIAEEKMLEAITTAIAEGVFDADVEVKL